MKKIRAIVTGSDMDDYTFSTGDAGFAIGKDYIDTTLKEGDEVYVLLDVVQIGSSSEDIPEEAIYALREVTKGIQDE